MIASNMPLFTLIRIKAILILFSLSVFLASCGAKAEPSPMPQTQEPLVIYGWPGYMPQGILDGFSKETGIHTQYLSYSTQDEALDRMRAGEHIDVVVLGNSYVPIAIAEGLLAPLEYQNIPNFRNISANFRDLAYDPGNIHSITFQWGTTGLVVRTDRVEQPVTSWNDLWNPDYAGKIGIFPYPREIIGITLKSLGYSFNSENPAELNAALEKLLLLRKNVFLIDLNVTTGVPHLLDDQTVMVHGWNYDAMEAQAQLDTAIYVLPREGTILWSDDVTIPANSQHKRAAERFIDFLLRPQISAQIVNELWIPSPNDAARPFIKPEILNNPLIYPPNENLGQAEFYEVISESAQRQYDQIWERFLAEGEALSQK
jgi:spermidine/putrescine transport system substrate-binding protein